MYGATRTSFVALFALSLLVLAGCDDDDGEGTTDAANDATATADGDTTTTTTDDATTDDATTDDATDDATTTEDTTTTVGDATTTGDTTTGDADMMQNLDNAYRVGSIDSTLIGPALSSFYTIGEWTGETDGPVLLSAATVSDLTTQQVTDLATAYGNGQIVALLDCDETSLDALTADLGIVLDYDMPRNGETTQHAIAEVYAFDAYANGETSYVHTTDVDTLDADLERHVAQLFADWISDESNRELTASLGTDMNVNIVDEATHYGKTQTQTIDKLTVQVTPFLVSAFAFDTSLAYFMVRYQTNVQPVSSDDPQLVEMGLTTDLVYVSSGGTVTTIDKTLISSTPENTPVGATSYMTGVNAMISGTVGFSVGTNDSAMASVTVGATFVNTQTVTVSNLVIDNTGSLADGFAAWNFAWAQPLPSTDIIQTTEHMLFTIAESELGDGTGDLEIETVINVQADGDDGFVDVYFNHSAPVPPTTM